MDTDNKKEGSKSTYRRTIIEWGVILSVAGILYLTGYHTIVIGSIQRVLLMTGIHQPRIPLDDSPGIRKASYDLDLNSLAGDLKSLSEFKGKVVFMNFWATWCAPCIAEMPNIQALQNELKNDPDIEFVMLSLDEDRNKAVEFISNRNYTFPVYFPEGRIPGVYNRSIVPRTYVLSPEGSIVVEHEGMAKYNTSSFIEYLQSF